MMLTAQQQYAQYCSRRRTFIRAADGAVKGCLVRLCCGVHSDVVKIFNYYVSENFKL